jgi:hypothetical protein
MPVTRVHACLNHLDLHGAFRLVVHLDGAMEEAAVIVAAVHVLQEVRGGDRRLDRIDFDRDVAELRLHAHADGLRLG